MAELTQFEIMNGLFVLMIVIVLWYIALRLNLKYTTMKEKNLILLSLVFVFQSLMWLAPTIVFLNLLLTGTLISVELYLLIGHAFNFAVIFWFYLLTELMWKNKQKLIMSILVIYNVVLVIIFFYLFFTNISLIGSMETFFGFQQGPFLAVRNLSFIALMLISVILFFRESHKSDNPQVRLRGTLFLVAIIIIIIGGIWHMITAIALGTLICFVIGSLCYYFAFLTPDWMKKRLIKEE